MENMTVRTGLVKRVLTDKLAESVKVGLVDPREIKLENTLIVSRNSEGYEYSRIVIRLSERDLDDRGNEKFIYDSNKKEYVSVFKLSEPLHASGKELRVLLALGEHVPVKIVTERKKAANGEYFNKIVCIQDQRTGKK